MFDAEGNLLGIVTGQWEEGQNLNFAIPTEHLLELIKKSENIDVTRKEIWESSEWKEWRKSMASHTSWQEKINAAAAVFNVHGPLAMIYVDLGTAAYKAGETEIARKSFVRATHYEPENPRAWVGMGLVELKDDNKQKAISDFEKTIQLGKSDENVIVTACQGLERAGARELALKHLKIATRANPSWIKASQAATKLAQ
jgi:tetratricopeptide (TPR) repeat protein